MSYTPITPAPSPIPIRSDFSSNAAYSAAVDAWMAWWANVPDEYNNLADEMILANATANYNATSTTSLAIATGSKAFTTQAAKLFQVGQFLIAASAADPSNFMAGYVTAYDVNTGSLTIMVTLIGGSGTKTDWVIALSGAFPTIGWQDYGSPVATTSGTSWTFASLPQTFSDIDFLFNDFSGSSTGALRIELSPDGVSYSSPVNLLSSTIAASAYRGRVRIPDYRANAGLLDAELTSSASPVLVTGAGGRLNQVWNVTNGIQAVRFSLGAGNGDGGSIQARVRR